MTKQDTRSNDRFEFHEEKFKAGFENATPDINPISTWETTNADEFHESIVGATQCGAITCPESLEIMVVPASVEESDVALIVVWSTAAARSGYVAAGFLEPRDFPDRSMWTEPDAKQRTEKVLREIVTMANSVIEQVRAVEQVITTRSKGHNRS